nr:hypothetical protein [Tanacetum cinerariifolium]
MPLGNHAAHWSSYIGEVIRGVSLYYPFWLKVLKEQKAALITNIGTQFDLRPHMKFPDWTKINAGIQQHLQKVRARPENITASEWDKYIQFWNDPRNIARVAQNRGVKQRGHILDVGRVLPAQATASPSGVEGAGTTRRVPTIRTTRIRMSMAILSSVIYRSFPGDMSPGNMCHRDTNFLTGKYVGPTVSLGIVAREGIPCKRSSANIPGDKSPGKRIPSDKSPGKARNCRWGMGLML